MNEENVALPLPPHMENGSRGPLCVVLNAFIAGMTQGLINEDDGFVCDDVYDEKTVNRIKAYQRNVGLGADGGCGPKTRAQMKRDNFDIELAARTLGGTTIFVQLDGAEIAWCPNSAALITAGTPGALSPDENDEMWDGLLRTIEARY
jgi:hypothetical protein